MKKVHTSDMVAHLWAHQSQKEARNAGDTFYFYGDTIYSYGGHFPIAKLVIDDPNSPNPYPRAVLFTTQSYSITTSRHIQIARQAINHLPIVRVHNPRNSLEENLDFERSRVEYHIKHAALARKGAQTAKRIRELECALHAYNQLATYMGKPTRLMPENLQEAVLAVTRSEAARKAAKTRKFNLGLAERREKLVTMFGEPEGWAARWCAGLDVPNRYTYDWENFTKAPMPCLLREAYPASVTTSWGATVPVDHARRIYKLWARLQGKVPPEGWVNNGDSQEGRVGSFRVDRIDADGTIHAGCHTITAQEVKRFARVMEWEGSDNA